MALPQDGQNANALATVKEVPTGKKLIFVDPTTNEGGVITLEDLTTQILKNLTSQTFALDQGTKTLPAALNELNSNRLKEYNWRAYDDIISAMNAEKEAILIQGSKDLSMEEIENSGLGPYYIDHTVGIWPQAAGGVPFNACEFQSKGDPITDLFEDLAAEQKARSTYDNILRVVKNIPEVADPIRFLRAREVVHFQRFGEALRSVQEQLDAKNFYAFNPSFDAPCKASCEE